MSMTISRPPAHIHDIADLGHLLRVQREQLGITQAIAAGLSGVSTRLWSECETGKRPNVSFDTALRMLNTVGLDLTVAARSTAQAG